MSENEKFYVIYVENDNLLSNNNELKCKKMNTKDKVINYLISNSGSDGNIKISAIELANMLTCTRQNITKIVKELEVDKIVTRKGKTIIVNKSRLILDDLIVKRNLTYSKREQELLYYMFDKYSKRNENFDYIVIPKHEIKKDTSIQNSKHINDYISKFVNDGLIEKIDGDWKKHKANKYKFIFDIDNINIQQKSNENPTKDYNNETIELLMKSIDELSEEITRMSERMDKMAKYCLTLKEDNEKLHQRLNQLENNSTTPTQEVVNSCMVDNIVTDNSYHQQKVNLSTTERIAIYNKFKEQKEKIIQYITDNLTQLEYAETLDDVLERMNVHHDMNIIYNQIGNDIDGIFYVLPKLNDNDGNLLVYRYLTDKVFLQRLKSIISNMN